MRNPFTALTPRYSPLSSKPQPPSSALSNPLVLLPILIVAGFSFFLGRHTAPSDSLLAIPCPYLFFPSPPTPRPKTPHHHHTLPTQAKNQPSDSSDIKKKKNTVQTTTRTFHYDPLFGSPPSNATNAAWHSLFPAQGGFFKHPDLAPTRSAFAVFHQLHCLVDPPRIPLLL